MYRGRNGFQVHTFALLFSLFLTIISFSAAHAQYFGKNKVKYEDFDYQVLHTEHFNIYHYPREFQAITDLARMSERWYGRYTKIFHHTFDKPNPLVIYANHADFQQTNVIRSQLGVGTGGVTEGRRNRVVLPFAESNSSTNHVLGHELVHAFQYDIAKSSNIGLRKTGKLPLWFIEGMAEYLSIGHEDTHTAMWMRDAILNDDLPTIEEISENRKYFPYRYGQAIWAYMTGRWGDGIVPKLYKQSSKVGPRKGFKKVLGVTPDSLSTLWRQATIDKYKPMLKGRTKPDSVGKPILTPDNNSGKMNVSPSLSPNGKYVAYITSKSLFALNLYIADAHTGKVIRKLTKTSVDPHMSALRFIQSAGAWSPDSKRFAFVVFADGDNEISITNVKTGKEVKRLHFKKVQSMTSPAWSPDGSKLVFAGSKGGYSDLYLYDFKADSLRNLTNDKYSDMQPTWSPAGDKIAFVTDRGPETSFKKLEFGNLGLATYDLQDGDIERLPKFDKAKHINPQFSPDGQSLYFISDYEGFDNVFRYSFANGNIYQLTNVATGISGISANSPAMTVARETGDMIVTVFQNTHYFDYKIAPEKMKGNVVKETGQIAEAPQLPPARLHGSQIVAGYMNNPRAAAARDTSFTLTDYRPRLVMDYIGGGAGVGISTSMFGSGAAGGINMHFSDMLNQHSLFASVRAQGTLKDISGEVTYLNQEQRFMWGVSAGHMAFRTSSAAVGLDTLQLQNGDQVVARQVQQLNRRIFQERGSLLGYYPFSRYLRMEGRLNYMHISYDYEVRSATIAGGSVIRENKQSLEGPSPLNLYSASVALVGDNSISAFTGPIRGHRFRLEVEPTTGGLNFMRVIADYRRYFFLNPYTIAFRALHEGRYLSDSNSDRLSPEFLGYETLVRGYNVQSFDPTECTSTTAGNCPEFNRLIGSRIGVANLEFRMPFTGIKPLALIESHTIPSTLVAFVDGGVAWTKNDLPVWEFKRKTADRVPVFSTGVSARVNLFGYLIGEIYYAVPFQRPGKGGYVGFHISQGW